jgi:hypothetical protein
MININDGFADSSGELTAYAFDIETGEFQDTCTLYVSEGCSLPPGFAADAPNIAPPGHVTRRVGGVWLEVKDCRGEVYRTSDGQAVIYEQLGELPEGLTADPRPTQDHRWKNGRWVFDAQLQTANRFALSEELTGRIDAAADSARERLVGDLLRAVEYEKAATEAAAFKDAGYPDNDVPRSVAAGVSADTTPRQAADSILAARAAYDETLYQIRELRLSKKYLVRELIGAKQDGEARQVTDSAVSALKLLPA